MRPITELWWALGNPLIPSEQFLERGERDERRTLTEMLRAGASALVFKASATEELGQAIRAARVSKRFIATGIKAIIGVECRECHACRADRPRTGGSAIRR